MNSCPKKLKIDWVAVTEVCENFKRQHCSGIGPMVFRCMFLKNFEYLTRAIAILPDSPEKGFEMIFR
ncbi:MAG: hypothetical protein RL088_1411 [Verrucomicrobiota bacterium]